MMKTTLDVTKREFCCFLSDGHHAWLANVDIAHNKAWTAVALKMPAASLAPLAVPNEGIYGSNTTNHGRVVVFGMVITDPADR